MPTTSPAHGGRPAAKVSPGALQRTFAVALPAVAVLMPGDAVL
ncbi:hypothetical protein ABZT02_19480 [Streptomyces sp. NPDC005402]